MWGLAFRDDTDIRSVLPSRALALMADARALRLRLIPATSAFLALVALPNCGDPASDPSQPLALAVTDTLVTTASGLIGGVYDLAVSPTGDLHVADYGFKHVLIVGPAGEPRDTIGNEGTGPGEFQMPGAIGASDDSVRVFDARSNLVQVFDAAGEFARSYRLEAPGIGGSQAFTPDGTTAVTIGGFDESMVLILDPAGQPMASLGAPLVPPVQFYDFTAIKNQIGEGRVPDAIRNQAIVAWGPDRSVYLAFLAEPQVRRYDADGQILWTRDLDEPVLTVAREAFFQKNREEENPAAFYPLRYLTDATVVDGDLWLLLETAEQEDGLLLVLAANDGTIRQRIVFPRLPNGGQIAADETRNRLYLAPREEASIVMFELPDG